jgi:AP-2 complex subunit alpha
MTLMLHEHSELLLMVVNSIKKDLEENNEYNNCLALHAIANVGSNEMAETLGPSVHRLLISPLVLILPPSSAVLMFLQDIAELCQEEGCADSASAISKIPRGSTCS